MFSPKFSTMLLWQAIGIYLFQNNLWFSFLYPLSVGQGPVGLFKMLSYLPVNCLLVSKVRSYSYSQLEGATQNITLVLKHSLRKNLMNWRRKDVYTFANTRQKLGIQHFSSFAKRLPIIITVVKILICFVTSVWL